jgi:hypothetical protein
VHLIMMRIFPLQGYGGLDVAAVRKRDRQRKGFPRALLANAMCCVVYTASCFYMYMHLCIYIPLRSAVGRLPRFWQHEGALFAQDAQADGSDEDSQAAKSVRRGS